MEGYKETKKTEKKEQKVALFTPGVQNSDNFIPVGRVIPAGPVPAGHRYLPQFLP